MGSRGLSAIGAVSRHLHAARFASRAKGKTRPRATPVAQWHASVAGGKLGFVATWDDTREVWANPIEPGDVLVSWNFEADWSADLVVPGASGDGYQGTPAVTMDPRGDLHLIWIERDDLSSPSRLRYMRGVFDKP